MKLLDISIVFMEVRYNYIDKWSLYIKVNFLNG